MQNDSKFELRVYCSLADMLAFGRDILVYKQGRTQVDPFGTEVALPCWMRGAACMCCTEGVHRHVPPYAA